MNKLALLLFFNLLISCGRENFEQTSLTIKLPKHETFDNTSYWINLFNKDTGNYFSEFLSTEKVSKTLELQVPNGANYVLYGYKIRSSNGHQALTTPFFVAEKAFFQNLDLSAGGVKKVDTNISPSGFLNNEYVLEDFLEESSKTYHPVKIFFRPCGISENEELTNENCPISLISPEEQTNFGSIRSMSIAFYKGYSNDNGQSRIKIWQSPCIYKDNSISSFDPYVRMPIQSYKSKTVLPHNVELNFFLDGECTVLDHRIETDESLVAYAEDFSINQFLVDDEGGQSVKLAGVLFRDQKKESGEACDSNYNCQSDNCQSGKVCQ